MKILYVVNNLYGTGTGLNASARQTIQALREAGQDVRVLSGHVKGSGTPHTEYEMETFNFPIVQPLLSSFGYIFAKWRGPQIEEAVRWADVIHLEECFFLEHAVMNVARRLGKPLTGTYHLHPENIFANIGMSGWLLPDWIMLTYWCRVFLDKLLYVQCPTNNVRERLERHHVKAKLVTISNGVVPDECLRPMTPPKDYLDPDRPLKLIYIGRLACEKDQATLLKAMRYSKYAQRIQLYFAGRGPKLKAYTRMANKLYKEGVLGYKPEFHFHTREELRELAATADLAAHCAFVEVEGMSIMEALQQAVVPVIAVGKHTGTWEYALDDWSKYPEKDPKALAEKIDYWFDHPEERWQMGHRYAEFMKEYEVKESAKKLVEMYKKAIAEYKK